MQGVRLALDADAPKHTLLIRGGRVESVLPADREFSAEYRVLDGDGLVAVPAFVEISPSGLVPGEAIAACTKAMKLG